MPAHFYYDLSCYKHQCIGLIWSLINKSFKLAINFTCHSPAHKNHIPLTTLNEHEPPKQHKRTFKLAIKRQPEANINLNHHASNNILE